MAKKKKTNKRTSKKKATKKKSPANSPARKTKGSARLKSGSTSVDGVLKKFQKERATLEAQQAALKKKIEDLNLKTRSLESQIEKLTVKEANANSAIGQLDDRRDAEVSELLASLGVKLRQPRPESASTTLPFSGSQIGSDDELDAKHHDPRFRQG